MREGLLLVLLCAACETPRSPDAGSKLEAQPAPAAAKASNAPSADASLAAPASTPDAGGPDAGEAGGVRLGSIGHAFAAGPLCGLPEPTPADCPTPQRAPPEVQKAVEVLLGKVAWVNTRIASESADMVRVRRVKVWVLEDSTEAVRVHAGFDADTAGSYRDTRGGGAFLPTGVSSHCVELRVIKKTKRVEAPACISGLGFVPEKLRR